MRNLFILVLLLLGTSVLASTVRAEDEVRNYPNTSIRRMIWDVQNVPTLVQQEIDGMKAKGIPDPQAYLNGNYATVQKTALGAFGPIEGGKKSLSEWTPAQLRYRVLLLMARTQSANFFKELRFNEPVFFLPGDPEGTVGGEKPTVILSRWHDVDESFGTETQAPPNTDVIYTKWMDKTTKDRFMLAGKNHYSNYEEKPNLRRLIRGITPEDQEMIRARVRAITKKLTLDVIHDNSTYRMVDGKIAGAQLNVAGIISRNVPLGVVTEYFGFYPPDKYTQIQWSRNTQNAFFHNPLDIEGLNLLAEGSGTEMEAYIKAKLLGELEMQMKGGRPAYDPITQMLMGHAQMKNVVRTTANIMGFVVGAGETSTLAVVRSMKNIMDNKEIFTKCVDAANAADKPTATPEEQELFDRCVWEALRFQPINPWVERWADIDFSVAAIKEGETQKYMDVAVPKYARVLVAMESAMRDSVKYKNPDTFSFDPVERPLDGYFHMSFDYHECLGEEIALEMIPEIVKQMLVNLKNVRYTAAPSAPPGVPFPEEWTLDFDNTDVVGKISSKRSVALGLLGGAELQAVTETSAEAAVVMDYVNYHENVVRVLQSKPGFRIDLPGLMKRDAALVVIQKALLEKGKNFLDNNCSVMAVEWMDEATQNKYCALPQAFRACYFIQRTGGQKTAQHAFNQCAYGEQTLSADQIEAMKGDAGYTAVWPSLTYKAVTYTGPHK